MPRPKGSHHSDEARAKIGASKKGVSKSAEHRRKISGSMIGLKRGPMSPGDKLKRSVSVRATLAAKKAGALATLEGVV